jgi:hypothetical protein
MAVTVELALLSRVRYGSLEITGSRLPDLLALLAADPHLGCSTSRLVDALWPEEQPEHPGKALQVLVSRARARLGPGVIVSTPGGYRLSLREDQRWCRHHDAPSLPVRPGGHDQFEGARTGIHRGFTPVSPAGPEC